MEDTGLEFHFLVALKNASLQLLLGELTALVFTPRHRYLLNGTGSILMAWGAIAWHRNAFDATGMTKYFAH